MEGKKQSSEGFSAAERLGETKTRWASPGEGGVSGAEGRGLGAVREPRVQVRPAELVSL